MNKKILLSLLILLGVAVAGHSVYAASANLSVLPASSTNNAGATFKVAVQIDPQGNQVCVVKGTLNLSNLKCKSITLASGVMAQTTPTCASPSFVLGIPKCSSNVQSLFSVSVAGINAGPASLSPAGASVVGSGSAVSFTANGGAYNIVAAPAVTPQSVQTATPQQDNQSSTEAPQVTTPQEQSDQTNNQPAAAGQQASLANTSSGKTIVAILIVLLVIIIIGGLWYVSNKKKEDKK